MKKKINRLSVVVPAYNEQDCIGETIDRICRFLVSRAFDFEIIVVDDGSSDKTGEIVASLCRQNAKIKLIKNETNRGKGAAVKRGVLGSSGDCVLFMDADFSTSIEEFDKFQPHLENGIPIVIGSRREDASVIRVAQPWYRVFMGQTFTKLASLLSAPGIHDFTCGFKCFDSAVARELFTKQRLDDWSFDAEILHIAHKRGFPIRQVPVSWENHPDSKVRIIRSTLKAFWGLIRIRANSALNRY